MKASLFSGLLIWAFSVNAYAQLTRDQISAKHEGLILYHQLKTVSAIPFLTVAAEAGDHEAQYYLGESLRRKNHYINPEARKWYEASAAQGDLYAMIQLGRSEKNLCTFSNLTYDAWRLGFSAPHYMEVTYSPLDGLSLPPIEIKELAWL